MSKSLRDSIIGFTTILAFFLVSFFCGMTYQKYDVPVNGPVTVYGCAQHGGVNESLGVGSNHAREALGVQCEDGDSYEVVAR